MSKRDPDAPPSYNEAIFSSPSSSSPPSPSPTTVSAHLATLPARLRARRPALDTHDQDLLTLLIPDVQAHLAALHAAPRRGAPPPRAGQLTLVPAAAVPASWHPSEKADGPDELWQTVRVRDGKGVVCDSASDDGDVPAAASASAREFDEWGRWEDDAGEGGAAAKKGSWWWRDEELAIRLAGLLRPDGRRGPALGGRTGDEMKVTAEEVSFRRENEMGLWESMNGWAVVVRITVRR
ncbi:hypothetical protein VDGE_07597 [Verticillium dahliae]|uniref:Uncharacterized protein n=1 Tax=Verticillium dahliae TaxID=27337 RepID=A0A444RLQ0_VERDA|nr:hypothetical protein VDGE_07597 [Verticillium dahliae]